MCNQYSFCSFPSWLHLPVTVYFFTYFSCQCHWTPTHIKCKCTYNFFSLFLLLISVFPSFFLYKSILCWNCNTTNNSKYTLWAKRKLGEKISFLTSWKATYSSVFSILWIFQSTSVAQKSDHKTCVTLNQSTFTNHNEMM